MRARVRAAHIALLLLALVLAPSFAQEGDATALKALKKAIADVLSEQKATDACNVVAWAIAEKLGCADLRQEGKNEPLLANDMCVRLGAGNGPTLPRWRRLSVEDAVAAAKRGELVLGVRSAQGHGHVVVLTPDAGNTAADHAFNVVEAGLGVRTVGVRRFSQAFGKEKWPEVEFFGWSP